MAQVTDPVLWDKDFAQALEKALERVKETNPEYTQLLPSDPGVTILDAALYVLSLYGVALNVLPKAALTTWVNYLGVERKGSRAALGEVVLTFAEPLAEELIVPQGTRFTSAEGVVFRSREEVVVPEEEETATVPLECELRGTQGNIPANRITGMIKPIPYVREFTNPEPFAGGVDEEPDEEAMNRGRQILSHLWRAVKAEDWEQVALAVPGVHRAKATEEIGMVRVYVLTPDHDPMSQTLRNEIWEAVDGKRMIGTPWELLDAEIKPVDVTANIKLLAGYSLEAVRNVAENALGKHISPDVWIWGRKVAVSEVLAVLEGVPGVDYVEEIVLPTDNITLMPHELATLGEVNLSAL